MGREVAGGMLLAAVDLVDGRVRRMLMVERKRRGRGVSGTFLVVGGWVPGEDVSTSGRECTYLWNLGIVLRKTFLPHRTQWSMSSLQRILP